MMQEQLGYLEGGSETLLHALEQKIKKMGGTIHLSSPVSSVDRMCSIEVPEVEAPSGFEILDLKLSAEGLCKICTK